VRAWKWVILGAIALGAAIALAVTLLTTPQYRAKVTLEVSPPAVEIMDEKSRQGSSTPDLWLSIATQVGLLSSRSVAERVVQDLNLANNRDFVGNEGDLATRMKAATDKVSAGLTVAPAGESQLIQFTYVSEDPELAAQIANGIAENFISSGLQRRFEASAYARDFLQKQISRTRGDLERSERALVSYAQSQGIVSTSRGGAGEGSSLQGDSLIAINSALAEATARRIQAEGAYRQARLSGAGTEAVSSTQSLRQSRAAAESEYQEKRTLMKPNHPEMISLRSRIDELDRQMANETAKVSGGKSNSLLADYRSAVASERALQARVGSLKDSVLNLRARGIQYNILQRDVDTFRALYDALLQRYKEIGVAGGIGSTPVSIVDRAEVPSSPYTPDIAFNMLLGLALGLAAGVGLAVALEILSDTIKSRGDVRTKLRAACLGTVPKLPVRESLTGELADPSSPLSEAYSAILAALRFSTGTGYPKTLLVSSARPSEGKSSTALALAYNGARRGVKVLLIDADLRRPAFRTRFKDRGLTLLLTNNDTIDRHLSTTEQANLWLLPCGPVPPNPADLLSTGRMAQLIGEAEQHFDMIIVDGPPILNLADTALLATACKNVMMVIEAGRTRAKVVREAMERIQETSARIVGVALVKVDGADSMYGYSGYRYDAKGLTAARTLYEIEKVSPEAGRA
jgi:capsular exopolysaccharide synthesis family protein